MNSKKIIQQRIELLKQKLPNDNLDTNLIDNQIKNLQAKCTHRFDNEVDATYYLSANRVRCQICGRIFDRGGKYYDQ